MAHGGDFVVFPRAEVYVAHPCLDMAAVRFYGYETAMQEFDHITDGVHGAHLFFFQTVVTEHLDLVGQIQIVSDGVRLVRETGFEIFVCCRFFS